MSLSMLLARNLSSDSATLLSQNVSLCVSYPSFLSISLSLKHHAFLLRHALSTPGWPFSEGHYVHNWRKTRVAILRWTGPQPLLDVRADVRHATEPSVTADRTTTFLTSKKSLTHL